MFTNLKNGAVVVVDPTVLPNAEGDIWDPSTDFNANDYFHVWVYLCEYGGGARTVTIGLDVGSAGSLGNGEYWLYQHALAANTVLTLNEGNPFFMSGDDQIRGLDNGAGGNVVSVHFRVEKVW